MKYFFSVDYWRAIFRKPRRPDWLDVVDKISPQLLVWKWEDVAADVAGAKRVAMGVWRESKALQYRFPNPFSLDQRSGFRDWMLNQLTRRLSGNEAAVSNLEAAFLCNPYELITEYFLHDFKLRLKYPHGLVNEGRMEFAKWLLKHGVHRFGGTGEDVLWFLHSVECDESDAIRLSRAVNPGWQADASSALPRISKIVQQLNDQVIPGKGVTVLGHFTFRSGLQRSAVLTAAALEQAGERVSLRNIPILLGRDSSLRGADFLAEEDGDVSVLHLTPDPFYLSVYERAGLHHSRKKRRIGLYAWELPEPPQGAMPLPGLNEIWVYSRFIADSLKPWNLPAHVIFPPMAPMPAPGEMAVNELRESLGLSQGTFVFLFIFDVSSTLERKNPQAVIEAFRRAVRPTDNARLILKATHADQHAERFRPVAQLAEETGVILLTSMLPEAGLQTLMAACDCYISLHRSEGFGFTMAEAMQLAKPVIATGYSGNVDYMSEEDSYLVSWSAGEVPPDTLTYSAGAMWAQPDVAHAAHCMRQVLDDRDGARAKGLKARTATMQLFDPEAISHQIAERLAALRSES